MRLKSFHLEKDTRLNCFPGGLPVSSVSLVDSLYDGFLLNVITMWSLVDCRQCQIIIIFATGNNYYFYTLDLVTSSCIE